MVYIPTRNAVLQSKPEQRYEDEVKSFARALEARYIDGGEAFSSLSAEQRRECWLAYDAHWGQVGSNRFAEFIADHLLDFISQADTAEAVPMTKIDETE